MPMKSSWRYLEKLLGFRENLLGKLNPPGWRPAPCRNGCFVGCWRRSCRRYASTRVTHWVFLHARTNTRDRSDAPGVAQMVRVSRFCGGAQSMLAR
jgi:hypothetical protein